MSWAGINGRHFFRRDILDEPWLVKIIVMRLVNHAGHLWRYCFYYLWTKKTGPVKLTLLRPRIKIRCFRNVSLSCNWIMDSYYLSMFFPHPKTKLCRKPVHIAQRVHMNRLCNLTYRQRHLLVARRTFSIFSNFMVS